MDMRNVWVAAFAAAVGGVAANASPAVDGIAITAAGPASAKVSFNITDPDGGWDYLVRYGRSADNLDRTFPLAQAVGEAGAAEYVFDGLSAGTLYYARLYAGDNALGEVKAVVTTVDPVSDAVYAGLKFSARAWNAWYPVLDPLREGDDAHRYWDPRAFFTGYSFADTLADWANYLEMSNPVTAAFGGYAYFAAGVPYTFTIDSFVKTYQIEVDGEVFYGNRDDFPDSAPESHTHTFASTGWHEVKFIVGVPGGCTGYVSENGLTVSLDGGATKVKYGESGDGTVFRTVATEKMSCAFLGTDGANAIVGADFDASLEGATVYACFASVYGANDLAAWMTEEIDILAVGQRLGSYSIAIPSGARYFRLAAVKDETATWSPSSAIADIEPAAAGALMAKLVSVHAVSKTAFEVDFNFYGNGNEGDEYDFELDYGTSANDLRWRSVLDSQVSEVGVKAYTVDGLTPGRAYYARLYGVRNGVRTAIGDLVGVTTEAEVGATVSANVGLWEIKKYTNNQNDFNPLETEAGDGELQRHRELGMPAFAKLSWVSEFDGSSNTWPIDSGWLNNGFGYKGYMYMTAGKTYSFRVAMMAQTIFIGFDGGELSAQWLSLDPFDYYVDLSYKYSPQTTGWHLVHTVGLRDRSISSEQADVYGLEYSDDGGANWHAMEDPGDGTLFRTDPATPLSLDNPSIVAGKLRATAAFDACIEGYGVYACFGDDYAGDSFDDWDDAIALDAVGEGERIRSVSASIPSGAAYCRFVAVKDGEYIWAGTEALAELSSADEETLDASLVSVASTGLYSATFNLNIAIPEGAGDDCDVVFTVHPANSEWSFERTVSGVAGGAVAVVFDGLRSGRDYDVTFHAECGELASAESAPVRISTAAGVDLPGFAGIWQGRGTAWDRHWNQDIMSLEVGTEPNQRCRQLGPMPVFHYYLGGAAYSWSNPFDPDTSSSWTGECVFVYDGYIRLEEGAYAFDYTVDSGVNIVIDGETVACTLDNLNHTAVYNCAKSGWHSFHFETQNMDYWGGYAGGMAGADSLRMSRNGGAWRQLLDPGDGSLFRVAPGFECTFSESGGVLYVRSDYDGEDAVAIAYGTSDGGDWPGDWDSTASVAFTGGEYALDYSSLASGGYARVFTIDGSGNRTSLSELVHLAPPEMPVLADVIDVDVSDGETISVDASAISLGETAASARLYIATSADFSDAEIADEKVIAATGPFALSADSFGGAGLAADTVYYWCVALSADSGAEDTLHGSVAMAGAPELGGAIGAEASGWNAVFRCQVAKLGAGTTTLTLFTGAGPSSLTNTASRTISSIGLNEVAVEFPFVNETVNYRFEISSDAGNSFSAIGSLDLIDNSVYYWKASVTNGNWTDPNNWSDASGGALDGRCSYPQTSQTAARFDNVAAATTVVVPGDLKVGSMASGSTDADIKFVLAAVNPAVSQIALHALNGTGSRTEFAITVPKGGYENQPLINQTDPVYNWAVQFVNSPKEIVLSVNPDSPAMQGGKWDMDVLEWSYGLDASKVVFANRGGAEFYFVYQGSLKEPAYEGENPTGIRVSIANKGLAILVR